MPTKIRAFISSTMDDLGNERRAVVTCLKQMNIEPVNAEALPPDGRDSWKLLEDEIRDCQICILISGRSYGWVPPAGPSADGKKSVTHLEYDAARKYGLVILPFFMEPASKEKKTKDVRERESFRKEIGSWETGYFRQTFRWADELADKVAAAVSAVLSNALRRELRSTRDLNATLTTSKVTSVSGNLHAALKCATWVGSDAVLFAGAGMSVSAGYPTAYELKQQMGKDLSRAVIDKLSFSQVADMVTAQSGRAELEARVLASFPWATFGPTKAHMTAVRAFNTIITTNFDQLFEAACLAQGLQYSIATPAAPDAAPPKLGPMIFKVDGTIERPYSLILSEEDRARTAIAAVELWRRVETGLRDRPLIVVGNSLSDPSSKRIRSIAMDVQGAYVTPFLDDWDEVYKAANLVGVRADADTFMTAYEQAVIGKR